MHNLPYRRFDSLEPVLDLIAKGVIDPKNYYSHIMPVEQIHEAMRLIQEKKALKVILTF